MSVERAGHGRDRLERVDVGEARQARHLLVEAGIVLHRAGAEREEPGVDAVVLLAEAHIMAHRLGLGEAGQADLTLPGMLAEAALELRRLVDVDAGGLMMADLEDQRLDLLEGLVAGEGLVTLALALASLGGTSLTVQHHSTSASAARPHEGRPVLIRVHFGIGDDQEIVEPGARQQARDRHASQNALGSERLDHLRPPAC
jgi:hypothetical protein